MVNKKDIYLAIPDRIFELKNAYSYTQNGVTTFYGDNGVINIHKLHNSLLQLDVSIDNTHEILTASSVYATDDKGDAIQFSTSFSYREKIADRDASKPLWYKQAT